jgi:4-hydroxy-tetrahydrodipicolinate reductase
MDAIIFGDGGLGRAIAAALVERGDAAPRVLGRPAGGTHGPEAVAGADVAFEASRGHAVRDNVAAALAVGVPALVIGTTAWDADRAAVDADLRAAGVAAVAASNFSLGVCLFGRLVEAAVDLFGPLEGFDPYLLEWHRRSKADRPSGTAIDLSRRILARHPRLERVADPGRSGRAAADELEVSVIRAGAAPGMHLVGFDAAGETVELRLTARDRSAYAAGALAAADWLRAARRAPGLHAFDEVVDDLIAVKPAAEAARSA